VLALRWRPTRRYWGGVDADEYVLLYFDGAALVMFVVFVVWFDGSGLWKLICGGCGSEEKSTGNVKN
jgi:hypothetical protein